MIVLGIDPGKTGALAILSVNAGEKVTLLKTVDYDPPKEVLHTIESLEDIGYAFIENVHAAPGQGVVSMFSFGQNYGWWLGVLESHHIPYKTITPQSWSSMLRNKSTSYKMKKTSDRKAAMELFPEKAALFSRVKDDGRADACLIGVYGIYKYL